MKQLPVLLIISLTLAAFGTQAKATALNKVDAIGLRASYSKCIDAADGVTPVMQSCMRVENAYQDKRLNAAYKKLRAQLDKNKQAKLRADERIWLDYRKSHCAPDPDAGQADALSSFDCSILETAKQAATLENRSSIERLKQ
ncbi:lysozyme inhibitor LprI family protein [Variovorax sp. DXTD-1]|uniref:lysozyme inhibitor LprI family protein n=1 Tax=Variovorax sp. DXTD-1 TaxID=2495592 RepID=UPI00163BCD24|nr:lysozyme inhibitor LprI family protein [Variovorax sp. DXTD-1]